MHDSGLDHRSEEENVFSPLATKNIIRKTGKVWFE